MEDTLTQQESEMIVNLRSVRSRNGQKPEFTRTQGTKSNEKMLEKERKCIEICGIKDFREMIHFRPEEFG